MTLLITLCYSFSTSLCPLTGSLQAAYAALEHTTLSVGGLYLPIKPKAFNQVFESPHHTFLLVGSLGPTALAPASECTPCFSRTWLLRHRSLSPERGPWHQDLTAPTVPRMLL